MPVPGGTTTNCTHFGQFAGASTHYLATPPVVWRGTGGPWLALHRRRGPPPGAPDRWQHRLFARGVDHPVERRRAEHCYGFHESRCASHSARSHRSLGSPAYTSPWKPVCKRRDVGSPPGCSIHLRVSRMHPHRIQPVRQLRLTLVEEDSVWPEEVWDALPDAVRREALRDLAELLRRWLASQARQS